MDKENATDKLHASQAFSLGSRGCIGRKLVNLPSAGTFITDLGVAYRIWSKSLFLRSSFTIMNSPFQIILTTMFGTLRMTMRTWSCCELLYVMRFD